MGVRVNVLPTMAPDTEQCKKRAGHDYAAPKTPGNLPIEFALNFLYKYTDSI